MKSGVAAVLLTAILWLAAATPALAGPIWCEDDPILHFDFGGIHLSTTFTATGDLSSASVTYKVSSATEPTVTYPSAGTVPSVVVWSYAPTPGSASIVVVVTAGSNGVTRKTGIGGLVANLAVGTAFTVSSQDY